jgi:hypothetical protein
VMLATNPSAAAASNTTAMGDAKEQSNKAGRTGNPVNNFMTYYNTDA